MNKDANKLHANIHKFTRCVAIISPTVVLFNCDNLFLGYKQTLKEICLMYWSNIN